MKVFFENDRLIFEPTREQDRRELAEWWAQLQTVEGDGAEPTISAATAERALVIFVPQR